MEFILHNGHIIRASEYHPGSLWWENELQFKQEMWFAHGEIPHFSEHLEIFAGMLQVLRRPLPPGFLHPAEYLRLLKRLINKNKAYMGGWVSCRFLFRDEKLQWMVSVRPHTERLFPLDLTGRMGVISPFPKATGTPLAPYPYYSETLWKTEKLRSAQTEGIFLNDKGFVTEADGANLFLIHKDLLITPSPETGCVMDIMRHYILKTAALIGYRVHESPAVMPAELAGMEEVFSVSEENGFRWLKGIGEKRYMKTATELICRQVNLSCFAGKS
jgi:branched-subunit amino acid aminotransferase/4-amino-4-deoxychorismate lyase